MASARCVRCGSSTRASARFCTRCGAELAHGPARVQPCGQCGAHLPVSASFCTRCGHELAAGEHGEAERAPQVLEATPEEEPLAGGRQLPPRRLPRRAPEPAAARGWPLGSLVADLGAAIALLGCFLPLAHGIDESTSLIPSVTNQFGYAYAVPACAILVALMAWAATGGRGETRARSGGGVIAVSSPWLVFFALTMLAATRVDQFLGPRSFGAGIGIGLVALTVGFGTSLVGGFLILEDAFCAQDTSDLEEERTLA